MTRTTIDATCRRCRTVTRHALRSAIVRPWASMNGPDDVGGITLTESGPTTIVKARKCLTCGHSVTA